ncbi:MAG: hypothetical protein K2P81_06325 [Bacteriovoracaceae bacterium]|nr:hypothetical protein [Bacteriovoracaceae bacterium]
MVKILCLLMMGLLISANRIEEQRKYVIGDNLKLSDKQFSFGEFIFYPHDTYLAEDVYFDSSDSILVKSGLGLRIRRVRKGSLPPQYSIQLKSEMDAPGTARVEEEDKDLTIQFIDGVSIISIVEEMILKRQISKDQEEKLSKWIERKATSSLAPFQELRRRNVSCVGLRPVVVGYSKRQRFHVIYDKSIEVSSLLLLKESQKSLLLTPAIIRDHKDWVWLMEASWDESVFIDPHGDKREFLIKELEVENKYRPRERGTKLLDKLEQIMINDYKMKPGKESKFLRARLYFRENT